MSQHRFIITSPDPHAITDAYAIIKVLNQEHHIKRFSLLVNRAHTFIEAKSVYQRISSVLNKNFIVDLNFLGWIPDDSSLSDLVVRRAITPDSLRKTIAGQSWQKVASDFLESDFLYGEESSHNFFASVIALNT